MPAEALTARLLVLSCVLVLVLLDVERGRDGGAADVVDHDIVVLDLTSECDVGRHNPVPEGIQDTCIVLF